MTTRKGTENLKGLVLAAEDKEHRSQAEALARHLGIPLLRREDAGSELVLQLDEGGLFLVGDGMKLQGDFSHMMMRIRPSNLSKELLVRAAKIKSNSQLYAIDATAGLGEDSLLLAAAGFHVELFEYNPVIAALLQDTLRRAALDRKLAEIVSRMELHEGDSLTALNTLKTRPDVILLDPMFPARQKSSLVKKKFQLLHHLEQPCMDEEALLQAAISVHPHKIVIKRPPKGPYLAGKKPSYSIEGKGIRFDCIVMV